MVARDRGGVMVVGRGDQRPQAGKHTQHIGTFRVSIHVAPGVLEDKLDLPVERSRFQRGFVQRRVRGAHNHPVVPRHCKQHAAIVGVRHHDCGIAGQKRLVEHQVHALARPDDVRTRRLVHFEDSVGKNARRVDHHTALDLRFPAVLDIKRSQAAHHARGFDQAGHLHVIDRRAAEVSERLREVDGESGIVELAVVVNHAASERFRFDRRNALQCLGARQKLRLANAQAAGQRVVNLHPHAVERSFPPLITRHDEGAITHQVRRVPHQQSTLA